MNAALKRWLGGAALVAATGVLAVWSVGILSFYFSAGDRSPRPSGEAVVPGLEAQASITRDTFGVPHIVAENRADAFVALGFAHAQDRLWQLEVLRRSAHGTLADVFGERALPTDRLARTLGFRRSAEQELSALRPETKRLLAAYSAGVNRWIQMIMDRRVPVPFEFEWLTFDPAPWTSVDTLALVRFRSWLLGRSLSLTLLLDRLVRDLGGVASQDFFPIPPPAPDVDRVGGLPRREALASLIGLGRTADALASVVGMRGQVGSMGFVVGASRSASRLPLLANDPHVQLRLPNPFYLAHLRTPEGEVAGATWPGIPLFWVGANRHIAWGQVALHASVSDLFDESLHPRDRFRYDWGGRWREAERRNEVIHVKGGPDRAVEVVSTRHGPLLASVDPEREAAQSYALRWTGQHRRSGFQTLLSLQRARDWTQFRAALRRVPAPASTYLYADRAGTIGSQVSGQLPIRTIDTGLLPVPGRSSFYDWRGFMPFDSLPSRHGDDLAFLLASTRPPRKGFPEAVAYLSPGRVGSEERLARALSGRRRLSLEDVLGIQRERHSADGRSEVRRLLGGVVPSEGPAAQVHGVLLEWDGDTETDSSGAAMFHLFRRFLTERLLADRLEEPYALEVLDVAEPVPGALLARFLDRVGAPRNRELVQQALEATWSWLNVRVSSNPSKWTWGRVHQLRLRHTFEELGGPILSRLGKSLGRGPFPAPGSADSIWTMHQVADPPFRAAVGPAMRFAIDLDDPHHLRVGLCGGQSGHPGSPLYDDALAEWLAGRPRPMWMHPLDLSYHEQGVWELSPAAR